jgi:hypothetical protein
MTREHKTCYGTMFHDTLHFETNKEMNGKVFSFELGSMGLGRSDRSVKADISEWDDCLDCSEFDHCYKLCVAKLALQTAIGEG